MGNLSKQAYKRRKLILKWRRFLGLCVSCGAEAYSNPLCGRCRDRQTEKQRASRERRKGKNLCRECGKVEVKKGQWRCDACLIKKYGENVCKTSGCNNTVGRNKRLCDDCEAAGQSCNIYFRKCGVCETLFTTQTPFQQYCSPYCVRESQLVKPIKRVCVICGIVYEFHRGENFDNSCSIECRKEAKRRIKRIHKQKRRAITKGAKCVERVSVIELFYRDGSRCQLCWKKLNLKRKVPHPMAVTIDHIVPLSKGGEHSYKNTQLACFMCNALKGAGTWPGGEQLRMFG